MQQIILHFFLFLIHQHYHTRSTEMNAELQQLGYLIFLSENIYDIYIKIKTVTSILL